MDVLILRIAYKDTVEKKVFARMISERKRIAERIRSIGKGEVAKIRGKQDLDLKTIQSEAYRESKVIRGKADAEATRIYAEAMSPGQEFYKFTRTLEAYKKMIPAKAKFIVSTDSDLLRMLDRQK